MSPKFILGEKVGMTQIFAKNGNAIPVTLILAKGSTVTQVKNKDKDGYAAIQVGFGSKKKTSKPQSGHLNGLGFFKELKEFRLKDNSDLERGAAIPVSVFSPGDRVKVTGISKSKGFQGVVKRHGFHGAPATHGTKHAHREPGSVGATWPQRVIKGMRMAGRMGGATISVRNLEVVAVDEEKGLIGLRGAIPGKRGSVVKIQAA